jgi:hypothetical protein
MEDWLHILPLPLRDFSAVELDHASSKKYPSPPNYLVRVGDILWTQDSINASFTKQTGGSVTKTVWGTVMEFMGQLPPLPYKSKATGCDGCIPTMRVAINPNDGLFYTIDNRRLFVYKTVFRDDQLLPVVLDDWNAKDEYRMKFTSHNRSGRHKIIIETTAPLSVCIPAMAHRLPFVHGAAPLERSFSSDSSWATRLLSLPAPVVPPSLPQHQCATSTTDTMSQFHATVTSQLLAALRVQVERRNFERGVKRGRDLPSDSQSDSDADSSDPFYLLPDDCDPFDFNGLDHVYD